MLNVTQIKPEQVIEHLANHFEVFAIRKLANRCTITDLRNIEFYRIDSMLQDTSYVFVIIEKEGDNNVREST